MKSAEAITVSSSEDTQQYTVNEALDSSGGMNNTRVPTNDMALVALINIMAAELLLTSQEG